MSIQAAKTISDKIVYSNHYSSCLSSYQRRIFTNQNEKLNRIRNCYDNIIYYETKIIEINNRNKTKEKEKENQDEIFRTDLEMKRKKNENCIKIEEKRIENELNELNQKLDISILKNESKLSQITADIINLGKEIKELDLKNKEEIELLKKEKLYELKNEYKLNLLRYKNIKELEKAEKEKNEEIKRKQFEAEKEIKFHEMKNKAEFVQKIISMIKNIELC